jgi:mycothiol synthase
MTVEPTLRPLTEDDVAAWAALLAAVEAVDPTNEHYNEADLLEELADSELDRARDVVGAFAADGELVGYYLVRARGADETVFKVHCEGTVHPEHRRQGIGTRLVTAMVDRARELRRERGHAVPLKLATTGPVSATDQAELLTGSGMPATRWNFVMRCSLDRELGQPVGFPEQYQLRSFDPSMSQALFDAHNAAFLDHPGFLPWTPQMWEQHVTGSRSFRPELTFLLVPVDAPDTVAAYVQTSEYDAHQQVTGRREAYVAKVGCRRGHRGRGLASGLLRHSLRAYREAGYDEASLDVDSENPTGALGLYERAGFTVETKLADYVGTFG